MTARECERCGQEMSEDDYDSACDRANAPNHYNPLKGVAVCQSCYTTVMYFIDHGWTIKDAME